MQPWVWNPTDSVWSYSLTLLVLISGTSTRAKIINFLLLFPALQHSEKCIKSCSFKESCVAVNHRIAEKGFLNRDCFWTLAEVFIILVFQRYCVRARDGERQGWKNFSLFRSNFSLLLHKKRQMIPILLSIVITTKLLCNSMLLVVSYCSFSMYLSMQEPQMYKRHQNLVKTAYYCRNICTASASTVPRLGGSWGRIWPMDQRLVPSALKYRFFPLTTSSLLPSSFSFLHLSLTSFLFSLPFLFPFCFLFCIIFPLFFFLFFFLQDIGASCEAVSRLRVYFLPLMGTFQEDVF